jgi:hypothetical protein
VAAGEDRGEELLDDVVLADDHLLQLLLHQLPVLRELLEDLVERSGLRSGGHACDPSCRWLMSNDHLQYRVPSADRQSIIPLARAARPRILPYRQT